MVARRRKQKKNGIFFSFSRFLFLPFHLVSSLVVIFFSLLFLQILFSLGFLSIQLGPRVQVGFGLNFFFFKISSRSPDVMRWFSSDSIATTKMPGHQTMETTVRKLRIFYFIHTGSSRTTLEKTNDMARWWWCVYAIACSRIRRCFI